MPRRNRSKGMRRREALEQRQAERQLPPLEAELHQRWRDGQDCLNPDTDLRHFYGDDQADEPAEDD